MTSVHFTSTVLTSRPTRTARPDLGFRIELNFHLPSSVVEYTVDTLIQLRRFEHLSVTSHNSKAVNESMLLLLR